MWRGISSHEGAERSLFVVFKCSFLAAQRCNSQLSSLMTVCRFWAFRIRQPWRLVTFLTVWVMCSAANNLTRIHVEIVQKQAAMSLRRHRVMSQGKSFWQEIVRVWGKVDKLHKCSFYTKYCIWWLCQLHIYKHMSDLYWWLILYFYTSVAEPITVACLPFITVLKNKC